MCSQDRRWFRTLIVMTLILSLFSELILGGISQNAAASVAKRNNANVERIAYQIPPQTNALTVVDGVAYVAAADGVTALDAASGAQIWHGPDLPFASVALTVSPDLVFASGQNGAVLALDRATGEARWSYDSGATIYAPVTVAEGTIFGSNADGANFALDMSSGDEHWVFETGAGAPVTTTVADGAVYVGSGATSVFALDAATGQLIWSFETEGEVRTTPVVAGKVVYAHSWDGYLYALGTEHGDELWSFYTGLASSITPVIEDGVVFVNTFEGSIVALDAATGEERWSSVSHGAIVNDPVLNGDAVYATNYDGVAFAVSRATGEDRWTFEALGAIYTAPAVYDGMVYVDADDDSLYALDTERGEQRWRFSYGKAFISPPAFHEGLALFASSDGHVYALDADTGMEVWSASSSAVVINAPAADAPGARDLLPEAAELSGEWIVKNEGEWTETDVALQFGEDGRDLLRTLGWDEHFYRDFERENADQFENDVTTVTVSIHTFQTSDGAAAALRPFSDIVLKSLGIEEVQGDGLGDRSRAFAGSGVNRNLAVLFVQQGPYLIRAGASSEKGDPLDTSVAVAQSILARIPSATESGFAGPSSPVAANGCNELPVYEQAVLAVENEAWGNLKTEFGIDEESDLFLLEPHRYLRVAELFDEHAGALALIAPPLFAHAWHEAAVERERSLATLFRSVPEAGDFFAAALLQWDESELPAEHAQQAYLQAVDACPAFEAFWEKLDLIDGDPERPPSADAIYDACEGLPQYNSDLDRATFVALAERPEVAAQIFDYLDDSGAELTSRTPTELTILAEFIEHLRDAWTDVTPPDYAEAWHLVKISELEWVATMLHTAARDGWDEANRLAGEDEEARGRELLGALGLGMEGCSVFPEFFEDWE